MPGSDQMDDGGPFRVDFTGDGVARLKETVREKLKEFMGDYTDDTLVEYVIVLLRNGRHKQEAQNELNVFLEEGSGAFVSWLWDHLSSNLHLYVEPQETISLEAGKTKSSVVHPGPEKELLSGPHSYSDNVGDKPVVETRSRRNREWKGLIRNEAELPPLQSTEFDNLLPEKETHGRKNRSRRSRSPMSWAQKKRSLQDEQQIAKREVSATQSTIAAPRRLLQFAVRDALSSFKSTNSRAEPTLKRLRSVVATPTEDSLDVRPQKARLVMRGAIHAQAVKAAANAAQDVIKVNCSGNVFDRLGRNRHLTEAANQSSAVITHSSLEDEGEYGEYLQGVESDGELEGNVTMLEKEAELPSDSASDDNEYEDVGPKRQRSTDASQSASSAGKKDSLMVHYSMAQHTDEVAQRTKMKDQDHKNSSRKIVNISVNVNTWKPPHYQATRELKEVEGMPTMQGTGMGSATAKENDTVVATNNNEPSKDTQKEALKSASSVPAAYSAVRPSDATEARTVFVNNVHFAATKDMLSRHFNKCGEVLKVVIVTDAATGQPRGSAYVEFMRKEAADLALSLDGTSFMSRILKVARRGSSEREAAPVLRWPRLARGPAFVARPARMSFTRGSPGAIRARLPVIMGPRSLQWKRGASTPSGSTGSEATGSLITSLQSPTARSLTYVRTAQK